MPKQKKEDADSAFYCSTPVSSSSGSSVFSSNATVLLKGPSDPVESTKTNKTYTDLVLEAVEAVGVKRKGSSYQAIKKHVQDMVESDGKKMSQNVFKKALTKCLNQGVIEKSNHSKDTAGVLGYYVLVKKTKASKLKVVQGEKKNVRPKIPKAELSNSESIPKVELSDSEAMPKKMKPKKLNLSDSAIHDAKIIRRKKVNSIDLAIKKRLKLTTKEPKQTTHLKLPGKRNKEAAGMEIKPHKESKPKNPKPKATKTARKDISDSEMVVKKPNRKSLKSYSSDTEINTRKEETAEKERKNLRKKNKTEAEPKETSKKRTQTHNEAALDENSSKGVTKSKKLYNKAEETKPKTAKARAKKI